MADAGALSPETVMRQMKQNAVTDIVWLPDSETNWLFLLMKADPDLRLLSRVLVVLRLVGSGRDMAPAEQSQQLAAGLCGAESWTALLADIKAARHRIAARWAQAGKDVE